MGALESLRWLPVVLCVSASASAQTADDRAVRPRFGVSGAGGLLLAAQETSSSSVLPGEVFGIAIRAGVQFNDVFALYLQPAAVVGTVNTACFGMTEAVLALWLPALVDFTFSDRISFAVGGGLAAVPAESPGWTIDLRVAGYPTMRHLTTSRVRHGLMVGLETRAYSLRVSGADYLGALILLSVGYERF